MPQLKTLPATTSTHEILDVIKQDGALILKDMLGRSDVERVLEACFVTIIAGQHRPHHRRLRSQMTRPMQSNYAQPSLKIDWRDRRPARAHVHPLIVHSANGEDRAAQWSQALCWTPSRGITVAWEL